MHVTDEQLFDLMDGRCTPDERKQHEAHLAQCPACRLLWDEYNAVNLQLNTLKLERAPAGFTETLLNKWQAEQASEVTWTYRRPKTLFWAAAVAACTLVTILVYYLSATPGVPESVNPSRVVLPVKLPGLSVNISVLTNILQQDWLMNGFLVANGLLLLLLLDRMVLKPFFEKRRAALAG